MDFNQQQPKHVIAIANLRFQRIQSKLDFKKTYNEI